MTDVYMTAKGGKDVTEAIAESNAHLGVEATNEAHGDQSIQFVDFPFTDPDATIDDHVERDRRA